MNRNILDIPAPEADIRIPYGSHALLFGDLRLPVGAGPYPLAIIVHGGFWKAQYDLEHTGHICAAITACGVATWNIEYRRIGHAGGGWPETFLDVAQATDFVRTLAPQHNLDLRRVITLGHSAGGHLALWLAARRNIPGTNQLHCANPLALHGAIALAGVIDLQKAWEFRLSSRIVETFLGGTPQQVPVRYAVASPIQLLPFGIRQLLIHGTGDRLVPFAISEGYYEAARKLGDQIELIRLPGVGHFELIDPESAVWPVIEQAVIDLIR